ncbi:MAG: CapA family protein [Thermoplasmatales archaeon]|nr:CapA family protein [Thermoplasmatales archaeon]
MHCNNIAAAVESHKKENVRIENRDKNIVRIAVAGDIVMMKNVQLSAARLMNDSITDPYERVASGFEGLFSKKVRENISSADLAFGNLETSIAEGLTKKWCFNKEGKPLCKKIDVEPGVLYDGKAYEYGRTMAMNVHPAFALALKNIGFDIVSTANNHFANRASNGIDATIDSLRKANLSYVGTLRYNEIGDEDNDGYPDNVPHVIKEVKAVKIAFLAFTSPINHIVGGYQIRPVFLGKLPRADEFCSRQVYSIVSNNAPIEFNVRKFCNWIEKAKNESDVVIVSIHFGIWQMHEPSILQKKLARIFLEAGADVIVGHGPHVIQPIEKYITKDGRETFIIYSLGNFIFDGGNEEQILSNSLASVVGFINILKNSNGNISVHSISYIPTFSYKNSEGLTQVIIAESSDFKRTKEVIQKVFRGNRTDRQSLSHRYLSKRLGWRLIIKDDALWERWILNKWKREKA